MDHKTHIDLAKKEAFSKKMTDILNHGALNLAMGLGYRNGIFDVLESLGKPVTALEISKASGLSQRYLEEWLGVMATGGIVELSEKTDGTPMYELPSEHACMLTRKSGSENMGVYTQEIPMLTACAMEQVHKGFSTGDGVSFACYPDFQAFMGELSDAKHREVLLEKFLPLVDNGKITLRMQEGIKVCDLGCGEGLALCLMAKAFPKSRFVGMDNHEGAIRAAEKAARDMGLTNTEFLVVDAGKISQMPSFSGAFDYICAFDAIHDQSRPLAALKGVRHMLAPGGCFSMIDIDARTKHKSNLEHPMGPFLYTVSLMHCMPVGLYGGGMGLGMMWGREKAEELLREAGFKSISLQEMEHDPFNLHYFCKTE